MSGPEIVVVESIDQLRVGDMLEEGRTIEMYEWPTMRAQTAVTHLRCEGLHGMCLVGPELEQCDEQILTFPLTVLRGVPLPVRGCLGLDGCVKQSAGPLSEE